MKDTINNLKFVWKYSIGNRRYFYLYVVFCIIHVAISILVPILSAKEIVYLTSNTLLQLVFISFVIFLVKNFRNFISYFSSKMYQYFFRGVLVELQTSLSKEILKLKNKELDVNGTGVFIQRVNNDSSRVSESIAFICNLLTQVFTNIGVYIAILVINFYAFLFAIGTSIILFIIDKKRVNSSNKLDKLTRKKQEKITGFVGETIRGARDVKMLNAEDNFMIKMRGYIHDLNQSKFNFANNRRAYNLLGGFARDSIDLLTIIVLVALISINNLPVAMALVIYNYMGRMGQFSMTIQSMMDYFQDMNLSAQRIRSIVESEEFEKETFGTKHLNKVNGDFEFKNVSFSYNDNEVLKNISFKVNANETVAFVGKSGVGKTTIFSLLCKMYDGYEGKITIDGYDIQELDKDSIRGNITIVSQNPYIFNLSIKDNLKLVCKNLTNKQMKEACKMACLDEFIESLPDKYDTVVGEGGVTLSGGQKQRLAIARAFVQKTEIILFDEATSALDNETQHEIAKAIDNLKKDYTILIIAHRLSTIKNADRILFIENGKVKKEGTHEELLTTCKSYKELYESEIEK